MSPGHCLPTTSSGWRRGRSATAFPAATDAPNLGIPAVVCGPGRLEEAHTTNEYVEIAQLGAAVGIYLSSVLRLTAPA